MNASPQTDPLAGLGAPVGGPPPAAPSQSDPLANIGTPVGSSSPAAAAPSVQSPSMLQRARNWISSTQKSNQDALAAHPVLSAINDVANVPNAMTMGALKQGARTVAGLLKILGSQGDTTTQMLQHVTGTTDQTQPNPITDHMRNAADFLNNNTEEHGFWEHAGGFGENIGELLTPEALGSLAKGGEVAKGAEAGTKAVTAAQKYADAAKVSKVLDQFPRIKALVGIGAAAAARGGAETGLQTYVKTGGDTQAATHAAELGAAAGGVGAPLLTAGGEALAGRVAKLSPEARTVEGVEIPTPKGAVKPPTAAQAAGAQAYGNVARTAGGQILERTGASPQEIQAALRETHDFTGVTAKIKEANNQLYDHLDTLTDGQFRKLNGEVSEAQQAAASGDPKAVAAYKNKLAEMDDLVRGNPDLKDFVKDIKGSWTQSYVLGDIGRVLDRSTNGLPGETGVSQQQRGIFGNKLETGLRQIVSTHGIDKVRAALGPGGLENLQAIAQATKTNPQRAAFNLSLHEVAKYLGAAAGGVAGHRIGGPIGGAAGALTGGAAGAKGADAVQKVLDAVKTNPKVGQNLIFAIKSGARPENYGPLIGAMITQSETKKEGQ